MELVLVPSIDAVGTQQPLLGLAIDGDITIVLYAANRIPGTDQQSIRIQILSQLFSAFGQLEFGASIE